MAQVHHWTPEQVDRMSDTDLMAVTRTHRTAAPSYREMFVRSWSARNRCPECGDIAKAAAWLCWCGGKLRPLTKAEVEDQWQRRKREEESRRASRKRVKRG